MTTTRPIRFGFTGGHSSKREKLLDSARTVEQLGYSTFGLADHFVRPFAPLIAGQAVADATTTLRITQTVLAQDFREPAVLAKELATDEPCTFGGNHFQITALHGLPKPVQRPHPPIMIGGRGRCTGVGVPRISRTL